MSKLSKPTITQKDLQVMKKRRLDHLNKKIRIRLNILWLTTQLDYANQIAVIAGASVRQVFSIINMYAELGLQGVMEINANHPVSVLEGFSDLIKEEFEKNPPTSINQARASIRKLTGIKRSHSQIRVFLKTLGMRLLKPGLIPMGKNETSLEEKTKNQREFVAEKLEPLLKEAEAGKRKVLFSDACHVQLACVLTFLWCFAKPYVKALPLRGRINIIGACSAGGEDLIYDIIQESVNENAIGLFLFKVRSKIKEGKLTIVIDNARYQKTKYIEDIAESLGIELLYLPVASPNLNIIERLWKFAKKKFVANEIFVSLDELQKHLKNSFATLKKKYKSNLRSLLTLNFQYFDGTTQFMAA